MNPENSNFSSANIGIKEKSHNAPKERRSVKSYASKVFQESTIGIVSSTLATDSKYRRFFKVFLFLLCLSGFLYQSITFLNHVFEYPETVSIVLERPDEFTIPAYTFCSNNPIKRSLFCKKYPDYCYKPSKEFCVKFNSYCGSNETLVPKLEYYNLERSMSYEDIIKYGNDEFLKENSHYDGSFNIRPTGPYLRTQYVGDDGVRICYGMNSVIENNQQLGHFQKDLSDYDLASYTLVGTFIFYIDEREMLIPGTPPGVRFFVHSPFENINPFEKGVLLKSGRMYEIYVDMEEERLLKHPFKTNCENYEELWKKNNHTGPRIQSMCVHKCFMDIEVKLLNCVHAATLYPTKHRICDKKELYSELSEELGNNYDQCFVNCRPDCKSLKYVPEVFEKDQVNYLEADDLDDIFRYITVRIHLSDKEIKILKHSPKYMTVEVFSTIGGFIGCWLGIALMDILDIFGSVVTICRYTFRKKT